METPYGKLMWALEQSKNKSMYVKGTVLMTSPDGYVAWHPELLDEPRIAWEKGDKNHWVELGKVPAEGRGTTDGIVYTAQEYLCSEILSRMNALEYMRDQARLVAEGGTRRHSWAHAKCTEYHELDSGITPDILVDPHHQPFAMAPSHFMAVIRNRCRAWLFYRDFLCEENDASLGDIMEIQDNESSTSLRVRITDMIPMVTPDQLLVSFEFYSWEPTR